MFGLDHPAIWLAYLLCILSTVLCVIYGIVKWNADDDSAAATPSEDAQWEEEEEEIAKDF